MKFKIQPILGDASYRTFYRLIINKSSKIVVSAKKEKYKNLAVYAAINNLLRDNKILAPKLFSHNYEKGILLLEDFGNLSFNKILRKKKNKLPIYKKLIDLLIEIQKIKTNKKIKGIIHSSYIIKQYSNKSLHKESDLFFNWYLPLILNKKKILKVKKKLKKILSKLYNQLNFANSCFVHRDYHTQNLMKVGNKIGVIDSQDALIGNPAYDLVSLIDDVRLKTSTKTKNQIYNYYIKKNNKINKENSKKFLIDFNILSVQRSMKIIGIFSRLSIKDNKKKYLKFIPYTWKLLEMRLNSEIFKELKKVLDINVPKNFRKKK